MSTPIKRRPDALRVPRNALPLGRNEDPDLKLKKLFAPVLGSKTVARRDIHGGEEKLVTSSTDIAKTSLYFPNGHPLQGEDRYHWFLAHRLPDGTLVPGPEATGEAGEENRIKLGYAKPDPYADSPEVQAAIEADYEQRKAELFSSPDYHRGLLAKGIINRDEFVDRLRTLGYEVDAQDKPVAVSPKPAPTAVLKAGLPPAQEPPSA